MNLLRALTLDYCSLCVSVGFRGIGFFRHFGTISTVYLLLCISSPQVHANQADEVYLRVGGWKSKLLLPIATSLLYSKRVLSFLWGTPCFKRHHWWYRPRFCSRYTRKSAMDDSAGLSAHGNKDFIITRNGTEQIISAWYNTGRIPWRFFLWCRVRFIRYDGTEAKLALKWTSLKM